MLLTPWLLSPKQLLEIQFNHPLLIKNEHTYQVEQKENVLCAQSEKTILAEVELYVVHAKREFMRYVFKDMFLLLYTCIHYFLDESLSFVYLHGLYYS